MPKRHHNAHATPSSPANPPQVCLKFRLPNSYNALNWTHLYPARHALEHVLDNRPYKQITPHSLRLTDPDTDTTMTIFVDGPTIDELLATPNDSPFAKQYSPPHPLPTQLDHLRDFHTPTTYHSFPEAEKTKPKPTTKPASRPTKVKAPSNPDAITIAQLAADAGTTPQKARKLLRENNIQKPPSNKWEWDKDDKQVKTIQKLLKQ